MSCRMACLLGLMLLVGCGEQRERSAKKALGTAGAEKAGSDLSNVDTGDDDEKPPDALAYKADRIEDVSAAPPDKAAEPAQAKRPVKPRLRKVIYKGEVTLLVEDFAAGQKQLKDVIAEHKAKVERSEIVGEPGQPRFGTWTLRVPAADFEAFVDAVAGLGEAHKRKIDSSDVSDRYYDTEAVALNLEAEEKTLRNLYAQREGTNKTSDVLEIRRELTSVRGTINTHRDQLKRWDNQTAYSTLVLSMHERKGYVPPESPAFGTTLGRSWSASIDALVATGKALVIAVVVLAPWLAILTVVFVGICLLLRAYLRRRSRASSSPASSAGVE